MVDGARPSRWRYINKLKAKGVKGVTGNAWDQEEADHKMRRCCYDSLPKDTSFSGFGHLRRKRASAREIRKRNTL